MENNGKGIFYGVIGVATLIVAIIGATFAYFSATAENTTEVHGAAATAKLTLDVEKLTEVVEVPGEGEGAESTYETKYGVMVPQLDSYINDAVAGTGGKSCIDANNNVVCQVYKVTITNEGTAATVINGSMTLSAGVTESKMTNLKWSVKDEETDTFSVYNYALSTTNANDIEENNTTGATSLASNLSLDAGASEDYYVVVWISEISTSQEDYDYGTFTGVVSFNSASGQGLTSTFTGQQ